MKLCCHQHRSPRSQYGSILRRLHHKQHLRLLWISGRAKCWSRVRLCL